LTPVVAYLRKCPDFPLTADVVAARRSANGAPTDVEEKDEFIEMMEMG
jgi:hypothetical protein